MEAAWIIVIVLGATFMAAGIGIIIESHNFNKGKCPYCNTFLDFFDLDSRGSRGYVCEKCGYTTWISYYLVDKWRNK